MPLYDYLCKNKKCKSELNDIHQSFNDEALIICPKCKQSTLIRVVNSAPMVIAKSEPTTIGQLAEKNSKTIGRQEIQERTLKDKENKKQVLSQTKKELYSKINKMSDKQKHGYIENG